MTRNRARLELVAAGVGAAACPADLARRSGGVRSSGELTGAPLESVVAAIVEGAAEFANAHAHVFRAVIAAGDAETNEQAAARVRELAETRSPWALP